MNTVSFLTFFVLVIIVFFLSSFLNIKYYQFIFFIVIATSLAGGLLARPFLSDSGSVFDGFVEIVTSEGGNPLFWAAFFLVVILLFFGYGSNN